MEPNGVGKYSEKLRNYFSYSFQRRKSITLDNEIGKVCMHILTSILTLFNRHPWSGQSSDELSELYESEIRVGKLIQSLTLQMIFRVFFRVEFNSIKDIPY